MGNSA
jgi:hypothetical protein